MKPSDKIFEPGSWKNEAIVQTKYGLIKGFADKGSTWCWKGIPYATPPVGELRWRAPLDPVPWIGTRNARKFGNSAAQVVLFFGPIGYEDCLYLNIWRPTSTETKLPVYFYIHGGGNSIGTSATSDYFGNAIAEKSNMVYVSVNYRLGVMGWFRHPAVTGHGSPEDQSGNFATLDLIKALEWVQDNIEVFGGDPNNVTIAGESAGGMNVLSLLAAPAANSLFHRAISESGIALMGSIEDAEKQANDLLLKLLVSDRKAKNLEEAERIVKELTESEINEYFRSKSAFKIMKSIPSRDLGMADWRTIIADGSVLPKEGYQVFSSNNWTNKVPLIIGCTKDEMKLFGYFRDDPPRNTRMYRITWQYRSLLWRVVGVDDVVQKMTSNPDVPSIYAYRFDWGSPNEDGLSVLPGDMGQDLGAYHSSEIPFFMGTGKSQVTLLIGNPFTKQNQLGREKLTELCMKYMANFTRTGNPNGDDLPDWTPWDKTEGKNKMLVLDADNTELRLSTLNEIITAESVLEEVKTELKEPERGQMLEHLKDVVPYGTNW